MTKRKPQRLVKPAPPLGPGWWVQWSGRSDWQREDETSGRLLQQIIVAEGDKVIHIESASNQEP